MPIELAPVLALRFEMHPFGGWLAAIPLAALFVAATVFAYRRTTRSLSPRQLRLLWTLRAVAVLAVLFVFLRPSWISLETRLERPVVVVLRDDSPSMGIADAPPTAGAQPGTSRLDAVALCLRANRANLQALAERYDLAAFDFSDRVEPLGELPSDEAGEPARRAAAQRVIEQLTADHAANGRSTRLGDALQRVVDTFANRRVAAVVLLSDLAGNASDVPPAEAALKLGHRGTPVYPVVFGSAQPTAADVLNILAERI